jgi:purine-binding chemotaxis protein CheW
MYGERDRSTSSVTTEITDLSNSPPGQYLSFRLGDEMFGVNILSIKEILEHQDITHVPMMAASIRGVINLRGAAVPVMDLMECFGKRASPIGKRTCIVIVEVTDVRGTRILGIVVDAVYEVLQIACFDIEPPPSFATRVRHEFIQGIGKVNGKFVILLNLGALVSLEEPVAAGTAA